MSLKIYRGRFCFYGVAKLNGKVLTVSDFSRGNIWPKLKIKLGINEVQQ